MCKKPLKITLMEKLIFSLFAAFFSPKIQEKFQRTFKTILHSLYDYSNASCPFAAFWHSHTTDSDSNKIRNVLRKFLPKRPTLQYLRDRGYIKGKFPGEKEYCLKNDLGVPLRPTVGSSFLVICSHFKFF